MARFTLVAGLRLVVAGATLAACTSGAVRTDEAAPSLVLRDVCLLVELIRQHTSWGRVSVALIPNEIKISC
jgi:hypothetical protein